MESASRFTHDATGPLQRTRKAATRIALSAAHRIWALRYKILQLIILLLRMGQLVATGILVLIYCYFVFLHRTHYCHYYPKEPSCRYYEPRLEVVPWCYYVVVTAAVASFFQLLLLACLKLPASTLPPKAAVYHVDSHPHTFYYGFLLHPTDAIVLVLYIIAFVSLSDYVVPTRILLGSRDGTSCYLDNINYQFTPVVLQQCVLAQHGYWWTMGAMLSYLITTTLSALVYVENSTLKRSSIEGSRAATNGFHGDGVSAETVPLLSEDTNNDDLLTDQED